MLWSDFKTAVRTLASDGAKTDGAYCYAISLWVLSELARQVDHDLQEYGSYRGQYRQEALKLLDFTPSLNGDEVREAVRSHLVAHGNRRNIGNYIDRLIQQGIDTQAGIAARFSALILEAIADIQHYIPYATLGHSTTFTAADVAAEGNGSHGCFPTGARVRQAWIINVEDPDAPVRYEVSHVAWPDRQRRIIEHSTPELAQDGLESAPLLSIEPGGREFYIWPALTADVLEFKIDWTGIKTDFENADTTPFDQRTAESTAKYISAKLPTVLPTQGGAVTTDLSDYRTSLRRLFVESGDRSQVRRDS